MTSTVDIQYVQESSVAIQQDTDDIRIDISNPAPISIELALAAIGPEGPQGPQGEPGITTVGTLEDLTDVDTISKAPGQFLYFDGSEWKPANLDGGTFN